MTPRRPPPRLYAITVDIYETATRCAWPIVRHQFLGRSEAEAEGYLRAHAGADRFLAAALAGRDFGDDALCPG